MPGDVRLSLTVTSNGGATEDLELDVIASFLPKPGDRIPLLWPAHASDEIMWEVQRVEWRRESFFLRPAVVLSRMVVEEWGEFRPADGDDREPRHTARGVDPRELLAEAGWARA
jgi:hypothetical protein